MDTDEREDLAKFVLRLKTFLRDLLASRVYVPPWLAPEFEKAFAELDREQAFENLAAAIRSERHDSALADHGLQGAQLRLKLELFDSALREHERAERGFFSRLRPKRLRARARQVLEGANLVLGSVATAVPIPGAGAAKEMKEAVEVGIGLWRRFRPWRRLSGGRDETLVEEDQT